MRNGPFFALSVGVEPNGLNAGFGTDWLRSRFALVADFDLGMRGRAPVADLAGDIGGCCGCCCIRRSHNLNLDTILPWGKCKKDLRIDRRSFVIF